MEYSGHATGWEEVVFRGDVEGREFIAFWLRDQRVLAAMNVNVWDVTDQIQALIRSRLRVDHHRLTDADTPLTELAPELCTRDAQSVAGSLESQPDPGKAGKQPPVPWPRPPQPTGGGGRGRREGPARIPSAHSRRTRGGLRRGSLGRSELCASTRRGGFHRKGQTPR
jgi:hypothetical protein